MRDTFSMSMLIPPVHFLAIFGRCIEGSDPVG